MLGTVLEGLGQFGRVCFGWIGTIPEGLGQFGVDWESSGVDLDYYAGFGTVWDGLGHFGRVCDSLCVTAKSVCLGQFWRGWDSLAGFVLGGLGQFRRVWDSLVWIGKVLGWIWTITQGLGQFGMDWDILGGFVTVLCVTANMFAWDSS